MERKFMAKASFTEMCKIIEGKENNIKECVKSIFGVGMLFFPGIMCKEVDLFTNIANGVSLLDAKSAIEESIKKIENVFKNKEDADFYTKYDNVQIIQVLIVFSAYFDSIKLYLPDESGIIRLSAEEKYVLTEESIKEYLDKLEEKSKKKKRQLLDYDLSIPNSIESFEYYLEKLRNYYNILNEEFIKFYKKLLLWEKMEEHKKDRFQTIVSELPGIAVENYKKQYYQLAVIYPEFFVWTNIQQHESISRNIDVGFQEISQLLSQYYRTNKDYKAIKTLEQYENRYKYYIEKKIVDVNDMDYSSTDDIVFPLKKEIFVPQSYKALIYKKGVDLENVWESYKEREDIGKFISDTLRHPVIGELPMLILGLPGAGKTLLCNMLAAQILLQEYHVIIVRLRDAIADDTIIQQINQQIESDLSNKCTWSDIVDSEPKKPILIIFDGYDELLQASGRTHADYINKIAEFQKEQKAINGILVKCIITSRIILISKALIPENSSVIKLDDFDDKRVQLWIDIWNTKNKDYFEKNKLERFEIDKESKVYELSKQPLLLLMLALYDVNDNILKKQKELNKTQLYDNLIREFVSREKRKDNLFRSKQPSEQQTIINNEVRKIAIAALGMYNRKALYIRLSELQTDMEFIEGRERVEHELANAELKESEKVLGGFFFIHKSEARNESKKEKITDTAYEFLHNTFGEFLTAHYIVNEIRNLLKELKVLRDNNMLNHRYSKINKSLCICLAYAPLFSRPVVIKMIHEWSYTYLCDEKMGLTEIDQLMEILINTEIKRVISGENVLYLKEIIEEKGNPFRTKGILEHLAIYSLNLMILRTVIGQKEYRFKFENFTSEEKAEIAKNDNKEETWNKLMYIWKSVFSEKELQEYAGIFSVAIDGEGCLISYKEVEAQLKGQKSRIVSLLGIEQSLGNDTYYILISALIGNNKYEEIIGGICKNDLQIKARYTWNYILMRLTHPDIFYYGMEGYEEYIRELNQFRKYCLEEEDLEYIFAYYLLLNFMLKEKIMDFRNEAVSRFVMNSFMEGVGIRQFNYLDSFRMNGLLRQIYILLLNLFDYIVLNKDNMEKLYECLFRYGYLASREGDFGNIAWDITIRLLNRCNEKNFEFIESYIYIFLEEGIVRKHRDREWFIGNRETNRRRLKVRSGDLLDCSYKLFMYKKYGYAVKIFNIYLGELEDLKYNYRFTFEQKSKIIVCINEMHKRKEIEYRQINLIFREIIEGFSLEKMFNSSEDIIYAYTNLMQIEKLQIYHKDFLEEAIQMIKRKPGKFSLGLYNKILKFAEKFKYKKFEEELKGVIVL